MGKESGEIGSYKLLIDELSHYVWEIRTIIVRTKKLSSKKYKKQKSKLLK